MAKREGSRWTCASLQTGQVIRPFFFWPSNATLSSNQPFEGVPVPAGEIVSDHPITTWFAPVDRPGGGWRWILPRKMGYLYSIP